MRVKSQTLTGAAVNFENTVIIMTSNAGSDRKDAALGFAKTESEMQTRKRH